MRIGVLEPGAVVGGRYRVLSLLGRGGYGAVYRVLHLDLQKEFALKLLNVEVANDDEALAGAVFLPGCGSVFNLGGRP